MAAPFLLTTFVMPSKKASARERADEFLAAIGTAGGPVGSPGLVSFGAGDLARQVQSGNIDEYGAIRAQAAQAQVGDPRAPQPRMPQDLDASYLKLNLPGSPLPHNGLLTPQYLRNAEMVQDQIMMNEQMMASQFMPPVGQLPMGIQPPMPQKKGRR
jgi:hypothetical protein